MIDRSRREHLEALSDYAAAKSTQPRAQFRKVDDPEPLVVPTEEELAAREREAVREAAGAYRRRLIEAGVLVPAHLVAEEPIDRALNAAIAGQPCLTIERRPGERPHVVSGKRFDAETVESALRRHQRPRAA